MKTEIRSISSAQIDKVDLQDYLHYFGTDTTARLGDLIVIKNDDVTEGYK